MGLIPQEALVSAAVWYTQLDGFSPDQVLETRLYESVASETSAGGSPSFLEQVAAPTPAPGGGSVAAHAAALGAGLAEMVAGLTVGKAKYKDVEPEMRQVLLEARELRSALTRAEADDAAAYGAVIEAHRLPKETDVQKRDRDAAIHAALLLAARVPFETATGAVHALDLTARCAKKGNVSAISDALSGAAMSRAALTAASYNVRINLYGHPDKPASNMLLENLKTLETRE